MIDRREENEKRSWLERVQEQSWEPEILISGIVLFALFQIPPLIRDGADYLNVYSIQLFSGGTVDESLSAILLTGNYWLIIGFMTHLFGRSIWAAFVGLSYVYQDGIQTEKLKYDQRYKSLISRNIDYKAQIVRLEKFCSRIFAVSFLLFMCIIGVFFFICVVGALIYISLEFFPETARFSVFIDPALQIIGLIYFFDFATLGLIKRIPVVNKIYYPFYRVMSVLTLAPLYRNIYYGFVTNHSSWKVGLAMLSFGLITFFMALNLRFDKNFFQATELVISSSADNFIFPGHYMNLAEGEPSKRMLIESDIIDRNVAKVFIVQSAQFEEDHIKKGCNYTERDDIEESNLDSLRLQCLSQFYILTLNGDTLSPDYLPTEDRTLGRRGLVAYIDLSLLPQGSHEFHLLYNFLEDDGSKSPERVATIEFYKSVPAEHMKLPTEYSSRAEGSVE